MHTERIRATNINLIVDGRNIEVKNESKLNLELNNALLEDAAFQDFAKDPKVFAARYNLDIDNEISDRLKERLKDAKSLKEVAAAITNPAERVGATAWAIASSAFSFSTSKVAVAFHPVDMRDELRVLRHLKAIRGR